MTVFSELGKELSPYFGTAAAGADEYFKLARCWHSAISQPLQATVFRELIQPSTSSPPSLAVASTNCSKATYSATTTSDVVLSTVIQAAAIRKEMEFSQRMLLGLIASQLQQQQHQCQQSITEMFAASAPSIASTSLTKLPIFDTTVQTPCTSSDRPEASFPMDEAATNSNSTNKLGRAYNPGRPLSMQDRQKILHLYQRGLKVSHIAKIIGVTHSCVSKIMSRYRKTGSMRPRSGQPLLFSRLNQQRNGNSQLLLKPLSSPSASSASSSSSPASTSSASSSQNFDASSVNFVDAIFKPNGF